MLINNGYTYSALNSFNYLYQIDYDNLSKLNDIISSKGFANWVASWFVKASDAVTSIRAYPFKIPSSELRGLDYINMGGIYWNGKNSPKARSFKYQATEVIRVVDDFQLPSYTDFTQIEPYTTAQLYLPFMGFVDINWGELIGNKLRITYAIDYNSGYANAYVILYKNSKYRVIAIKSGKIGFEVAWGTTNMAENLRRITTTIVSTAISIYTIGASKIAEGLKTVAKVGAITKAGVSIANSTQVRFDRGGSVEGMGRTSDPTTPHIILRKQKVLSQDNFNKIYGRPLYQSRTLSGLRGFTIVDDIHLSGFPTATSDELNEIERLLKTGVHL